MSEFNKRIDPESENIKEFIKPKEIEVLKISNKNKLDANKSLENNSNNNPNINLILFLIKFLN